MPKITAMRLFVFVLFLIALDSNAQLFDQPQRINAVRKGVDYVYNLQMSEAKAQILQVEKQLPDHPVVPLMRGLVVLWSAIPNVTVDSTFSNFEGYMNETIRLAMKLDGGRQQDDEAIFFELSARGLLAEYYADAGQYMKAIGEANKAYGLLRSAFELSTDNPEFFLPLGVYNYFRETYPQRHPVYKPFLWFFKSGDVEKGLSQIKDACHHAVLTKVEAYVYLSYIYLRYEEVPGLAVSYLKELHRDYPNNRYVLVKYLESLNATRKLHLLPMEKTAALMQMPEPYYQMAGRVYLALHEIHNKEGDLSKAKRLLDEAVTVGVGAYTRPQQFFGLAYLGLAQIAMKENDPERAEMFARKAMEEDVTQDVVQAAKSVIYSVK